MKAKGFVNNQRSDRGKGRSRGRKGPRKDRRCAEEAARERILKGARAVFALHSFKAATTRMIAQAAGVDHPLIHYHVGSKENLFEAVTAEIYEEFGKAHLTWLQGLERMSPRKGLSVYLDRLLEYNLAHPEPLQIILLNMGQIGRLEEIPGYEYILLHMERVRRTLQERIPLRGSPREVEMFIHCFTNLLFSLIGARSCQAQVLGLDPGGEAYRKWMKDALTLLFLPWLERLLLPDKEQRHG